MAYGLEELPASQRKGKGVAENIKCVHNSYEIRSGGSVIQAMEIFVLT